MKTANKAKTVKRIVNSASIKYIESGITKVVKCKTEAELHIFRKGLERKGNFKLIGQSIDVTYPIGYDCYADENN